jgi:hypothetical protein
MDKLTNIDHETLDLIAASVVSGRLGAVRGVYDGKPATLLIAYTDNPKVTTSIKVKDGEELVTFTILGVLFSDSNEALRCSTPNLVQVNLGRYDDEGNFKVDDELPS